MRPVSVFANGPDAEAERLRAQLRGTWRQAARAVMVLLSLHELAPGARQMGWSRAPCRRGARFTQTL